MATYGLWLWLLVNLQNDPRVLQRIAKRNIENTGECPSQESRQLNSFLWALERNPPVYFFGTIHVPYTKVWDHIPANSEAAFYDSQNVFFELDLTDPVTLQTLAQCQILPGGATLRDVIPRSLFRRIRKHLSYISRVIPKWMTVEQRIRINPAILYTSLTKNWRKKRPIWIMLMLNGLNEYDTKNRGVPVLDTFLIDEAVSLSKTKGSIESVEDQCGPLNALNNSQVIVALNQTLVLHEKIRHGKAELTYSTKELIYHYNCGDLNEVLFKQNLASVSSLQNSSSLASSRYEMEEARKLDEYLKEELIYKRNRRMAKQVLKLIKEEPKKKFFFAFGAGHFLGNDSVIEILKKQGHNVTHIKPDAKLPMYGKMRTAKEHKKLRWTRQRSRRKGRRGKRKRRRSRMQNRRMLNVDNLWKKAYPWTKSPKLLKPTTHQLDVGRTTRSLEVKMAKSNEKEEKSSGGIDVIDSGASSLSFTAWLLWTCLLLLFN